MIALLISLMLTDAAFAQTPRSAQVQELKQLTIEELVDTDVTSPSRRAERLGDVAAAVTVITSEDLRRMGVMTLTQALRLAGQLHVSQVAGPQYAISARGFAISTANKLLVMIDGRTVYSPVFAGVFWEMQDVVIADVDRIEVTRGPGGSLWGANAVNGVINVITKSAHDTKGTFVNASTGSSTQGPFALRYGGRLGTAGAYRVYAKTRFEDAHQLLSGTSANDGFDFTQAGFRIDSDPSAPSQVTLQGDAFSGGLGLLDGRKIDMSGGNVLARWSASGRVHSSSVQAYFDHTYRRVPSQYRGELTTIDIDAQHHWRAPRNNILLGAGYRHYDGDDLGDGPGFFFEPRQRASHRLNVFAQDEFSAGRGVFVTLGSKFERNEFTGFEVQPTLRARWSGTHQSVWGAVSRAVRVPTRFDTDLRIRVPNAQTIFLTGNEAFKSESVVAYEAGYRRQFGERLALDVAGYVNRYDDLRSQEIRAGQPILLENMLNGLTRGIESTASLQLLSRWQVHVSHSYLWKDLTFDPGSTDPTGGASEGNDPQNLVAVRSYATLAPGLELDAFFRYAGALPQPAVPAYNEMDARLGYRIRPWWDVSLIGTNLLHDRHLEFRAGTPAETFERAVTLRSVWRF